MSASILWILLSLTPNILEPTTVGSLWLEHDPHEKWTWIWILYGKIEKKMSALFQTIFTVIHEIWT